MKTNLLKKGAMLVAVLSICQSAICQHNVVNNRTTINLKGDVQMIFEKLHEGEMVNGKFVKGGYSEFLHYYEFNNNGDLIHYMDKAYDLYPDGRVKEIKGPEDDAQRIVYIYDANNTCTGKEYYNMPNGREYKSKCKLDGNGNITVEVQQDGNSVEIMKYEYLPSGILKRESIAYKSGTEYFWKDYEFDAKNNPIKLQKFDDIEGENNYTYRYITFDDNGNWTECIRNNEYEGDRLIVRDITYFE